MPRPVKYTDDVVEKKSRSEVLKMSAEEKKAYQLALNRARVRKNVAKKGERLTKLETEKKQEGAVKTLQAVIRRRVGKNTPLVPVQEVVVPVPVPVVMTDNSKGELEKFRKIQQFAKKKLEEKKKAKMEGAVVKIQTAVRAKQARKEVKDMTDAVKKLQAVMKRKVYYDALGTQIKAEAQRKVYEKNYAKRQEEKAQAKADTWLLKNMDKL